MTPAGLKHLGFKIRLAVDAVLDYLVCLVLRRPPFPYWPEHILDDRDSDGLTERMNMLRCPDCGRRDGWLEGPSAGLGQNVQCGNEACAARFNVFVIPGHGLRVDQRIRRSKLDRRCR